MPASDQRHAAVLLLLLSPNDAKPGISYLSFRSHSIQPVLLGAATIPKLWWGGEEDQTTSFVFLPKKKIGIVPKIYNFKIR